MRRGVVRIRAYADGGKRTVRLSGAEFIGRFLTHVLPPGFKRICHRGLVGPAHKQARLAAARVALQAPQPVPAVVEFFKRIDRLSALACSHCGREHFVVAEPIPPAPTSCRSRASPWTPPAVPRRNTPPMAPTPASGHPKRAGEPPYFATASVEAPPPHASVARRRSRLPCNWLATGRCLLKIPIATAVPAVQSNEVYPPPSCRGEIRTHSGGG